MPKKEKNKAAKGGKWPFLALLIGEFAWDSLWAISAGLRMAGLKYINEIQPWVTGWGVMGGLGTEAARI